jgi:hypothetical protein
MLPLGMQDFFYLCCWVITTLLNVLIQISKQEMNYKLDTHSHP